MSKSTSAPVTNTSELTLQLNLLGFGLFFLFEPGPDGLRITMFTMGRLCFCSPAICYAEVHKNVALFWGAET
jgi:hypothetical protein